MADWLRTLTTLGGAGMFAVFVFLPYVLIARGRLVPRSTLEDVIKDRDTWRSAHTVSEDARREDRHQTDRLLEVAHTTESFIRAIQRPGVEP